MWLESWGRIMNFPQLKTGAVAQYPALREVERASRVMRFVDGGEQRYRERGVTKRRWLLRFAELDENEMVALRNFFAAQQGDFGSFAFTDPWDGTVYPDCSFTNSEELSQWMAENAGGVALVIEQNV